MMAGQFSIYMALLLMAIVKLGLISVPSFQLCEISMRSSHDYGAYLIQMNIPSREPLVVVLCYAVMLEENKFARCEMDFISHHTAYIETLTNCTKQSPS
jgi:hypothetical protein